MSRTSKTTFPRRRAAPKARKRSDAERLRAAIDSTIDATTSKPITDRRFAEAVLFIHDRTLRKYLGGRRLPGFARALVDRIEAAGGSILMGDGSLETKSAEPIAAAP